MILLLAVVAGSAGHLKTEKDACCCQTQALALRTHVDQEPSSARLTTWKVSIIFLLSAVSTLTRVDALPATMRKILGADLAEGSLLRFRTTETSILVNFGTASSLPAR